jgi:hypothetical protein
MHKLSKTSLYFTARHDTIDRIDLTLLIMCAFIILHSMIIDDEQDNYFDENYHTVTSVIAPPVNYEVPASLTSILQKETELISRLIFLHIQFNLFEHVWKKGH